MRPMMTLPDFLKDVGDTKVADAIGVSPRAVLAWRLRERYPRPAQAAKLVEFAAGRLDYSGIYAPVDIDRHDAA